MSNDCLFCRAPQPVSHVMVQDTEGRLVGRVCGKHSLRVLILRGFFVLIEAPEVEKR